MGLFSQFYARWFDRVTIGSTGRQTLLSLTLLAAVAASLWAAPGPDGVLGAFLGALVLAIAVTDFHRYIIPDELTGAAVGLALFRAAMIGPEDGTVVLPTEAEPSKLVMPKPTTV